MIFISLFYFIIGMVVFGHLLTLSTKGDWKQLDDIIAFFGGLFWPLTLALYIQDRFFPNKPKLEEPKIILRQPKQAGTHKKVKKLF